MASFPSIRIEGGLFGPDFLDQVARGEVAGQKPTDFGLETRRNLTDEIAAAFADARAYWDAFNNRLERIAEDDLATSLTREGWILPFLNTVLKYNARFNQKAYDVGGLSFAISHRASDHEDAPPVHIVGYRQDLGRVPESGRPRLSPHALLQEFLNRHEHLWGIVTNGKTLRILRDSTFIRRQAYLEFDLTAIFEEQRFEDFAILYRLLHRTRLPYGQADGDQCLLEQYYSASQAEGGRVREHLRDGVEECLLKLANGFLSHKANDQLRQDISQGNYAAEKMYQHLLRIVYRLLFLIVSEDRRLLTSNAVYTDHYSIARLRRLVQLPAAHTYDADLCHSLQVLWRLLSDDTQQRDGKPLASVLELPVLNGELFTPIKLDDCLIDNRQLLDAIEQLTYWKPKPNDPPRRVNYAALDVEELGSVYESLLELHPEIHFDTRGLPQFLLPKGAGRKETGSYYTPPSLVNELIHSALEPVIEERLKAAKALDKDDDTKAQQKAILDIKVIDPACGSGHLILAAARRLGKELARLRTGEDEPPPERNREAIRDIISHCIYGVDKNPLAVDLCRVALWLESHCSGKPLTFLDHRIRHGDSLVGVFDLQALSDGIPKGAFDQLLGDDKDTVELLAARNKQELRGQRDLFAVDTTDIVNELKVSSLAIDALSDDSPELIRKKKQRYEQARQNPEWVRNKEACDLWTSVFFVEKTVNKARENSIATSMVISDHLSRRSIDQRYLATARTLAIRNDFFHWPLEFPEAFSRGGFDVVLSNPPWERIKLQEQEFFAVRDIEIADAPNAVARKRMIAELPETKPDLHKEYLAALRSAAGASSIMRNGGRYPLAGRGDINLYAVFAELGRTLVNQEGRAGLIVPTGIATDDTTKYFFQDIIYRNCLVSLYDFENRKKLFPAVDSRMKFCLFTVAGCDLKKPLPAKPDSSRQAKFVFYAQEPDDLRKPEKVFTLTSEDFLRLNPNTGTCPIFRSSTDAELSKLIYRRIPVLCDDHNENNFYKVRLMRVLDMNKANVLADCQRADTIPSVKVLPVYEGKLMHQYDHRFATYGDPDQSPYTMAKNGEAIKPRWLVKESTVEKIVSRAMEKLSGKAVAVERSHLFSYRDFTNTTNERTCIAAYLPYSGTDFTLRLFLTTADSTAQTLLMACFNSFAFDYCTRQKTAGTHLSDYIMKQLPIPPVHFFHRSHVMLSPTTTDAIRLRVLELSYTSVNLRSLAENLGYSGPPFLWDEDRRYQIRCELDAYYFHLYLGSTDDWQDQSKELRSFFPKPRHAVQYIMDTFPIVKEKDEEEHGTFRTKNKILEIYDAMEEARRSGTPWVSPLTFPDIELQADGDKAQISVRDDANSQADMENEDDGDEDEDDRTFDDETTDTDDLGEDEIETDDEKTEVRIRQYNSIDDYLTEDLMYAVRKTYTERGSRLGYDREEGLHALRKYLNMGSLGSNIRYALENAVITAQKREVIYSMNGSHYLWRRTLKDYIQEAPDPYKNLRKYLRAAMGSNAWQEEGEAITAATRYLGFARTTEQMTKIFKSVINSAIRRGRIERDGSRIRKV